MALAVLVTGLLHELLPRSFQAFPFAYVLYPAFLLVFLVVLVVGDPGRIDRDRHWLRVTTGLMIAVITLVNGTAAARLVVGILTKRSFDSAGQLLLIGGVIWMTNVIAFALWFWDLDAGGAAARAARPNRQGHAFVFPEMTLDDLVPAGWFPRFVDYLAMSFYTALAFGPTDVSAIRSWAKVMLIAESLISLVLVGLVIARAVNVL
jgi:hypothetical protein